MNQPLQKTPCSWTHIAEQLGGLEQPLTSGPKQDSAAPVIDEALSEEEQILLRRYRQCPQAAQSCLQLMAGLLVVKPS